MSGVRPPAGAVSFSAESLAPVLATIPKMDARPSLAECSALLLGSGKFKLLAATNGGIDSTRGLFDNALGEAESAKWGVFSCDTARVAKPAPAVYESIWQTLGEEGKDRSGWFMASHCWCAFSPTCESRTIAS